MDDTIVLKQELVSVQKLMDDVAREKESELMDLRRLHETAVRHGGHWTDDGQRKTLRYLYGKIP